MISVIKKKNYKKYKIVRNKCYIFNKGINFRFSIGDSNTAHVYRNNGFILIG